MAATGVLVDSPLGTFSWFFSGEKSAHAHFSSYSIKLLAQYFRLISHFPSFSFTLTVRVVVWHSIKISKNTYSFDHFRFENFEEG